MIISLPLGGSRTPGLKILLHECAEREIGAVKVGFGHKFIRRVHGNDGNQGTAEAPFKTLEAAVAAIEASEYEQGVVNIIGTLEISGDLPEHGKMLTLQGSTPQDGILISKAFTVNGPVTFQEMKVTLTDAYLSIYGEGDEVNFGQGITNSLYPYLRLYLGTYNSDNPQAERGTVDSGRLYTVNIGAYNSMGTDKSTAGVSYVQNGGEVSYLYLGGDGYEAAGVKFLKTIFTENVNFTLNGGQVGEIRLLMPQEGAQGSLTERDVVFEKAVQILINNDAAVSNALPEITAAGGVWVMDSAGTGHALSVTDTAGVYTVPDGLTAVAYAQDGSDIYVSEDGILTVTEPGTYRVEYETDLTYTNSGTEITFYQATTVDFEELTHREMEGKLFVGWVDEEGNVTIVGEGTATITVTTFEGGNEAECIVTVQAAETDAPAESGCGGAVVGTSMAFSAALAAGAALLLRRKKKI